MWHPSTPGQIPYPAVILEVEYRSGEREVSYLMCLNWVDGGIVKYRRVA